jgi:hypothetical protein
MATLKLVDRAGNIMGAIVIPDAKVARFAQDQRLTIQYVDALPVSSYPPHNMENVDSHIHIITIVPAHTRSDAVMLAEGALYDLEKVEGCFFIPGYAFSIPRTCFYGGNLT